MPIRMGALYDALLLGNVPEDAARKAAEEIADYETKIGRVERDLTILKWMVGTVITLQLLLTGGLLSFAWRLIPAITR